ncbi:hypothetical protein TCE0_039r13152 [Talaromyces pinophilus]|uniref:Uncharacterized protein n=1 Tax=Talaromyces pinophilus TaxID=128442 RepID=A0A6N4SLP8_TALPI|nr:hypothetical protein TCE0_039r13152 [Talaromyces pinophilus]
MVGGYKASEISMIEQGMGGDRAVMDFANDGIQQVIGFDTFRKDDHHGVPRYQRLAVEETYSSGHEAEEGSVAFVLGLGSVTENIC